MQDREKVLLRLRDLQENGGGPGRSCASPKTTGAIPGGQKLSRPCQAPMPWGHTNHAAFFFFLSSGKHPTQAQTPTSKSFIFSPFPGSVACGLGFPSSLVLTPPTTPLLGEPENSRAQAIMAHYGFLTGEASHVNRVAVSLCDGGLCYLGFRPITADPTSFQEHGRKKNDIETLHFWKSRHGPLASGTIPLDPPLA